MTEINKIMEESGIKICNDFKPILMSWTNNAMQYCSYLRVSIYRASYQDIGWYKEKTNDVDSQLRGVLNRFCNFCITDGEESIAKSLNNNEFLGILNQLETQWSKLKDLSIEINHRLNLDLMDYDRFRTDVKRKEALNKLL